MSGTSMAAPHVGGTAALYLSNPINTGATPATVEYMLKVDAWRVQIEDKRSKDGSRIRLVYAGDY
jgi:subtilisin family serine protease